MDLSVKEKFDSYPNSVSKQLTIIRELIFSIAKKEGIEDLSETLKWGEPTYISDSGSAIRIDWKAKYPTQFCVYFNCKTSLVATFKEVYTDTFSYDGNRALIFELGSNIPMTELSHCISLSLRYKKIKHLELLGI